MNYQKYQKMYHPVKLENREWPANEITKAPIWCSVDLRDGNQALYSPMTTDEKIEFFKFLVKLGFKEIEVGFPAASNTEFEFVRRLIDENIIPDDVTIQVLTQAREHIITKTVEALKGAKNAIIHLYNSTSTLQREVVFKKNMDEIKQLAIDGAKLVKSLVAGQLGGNIRYKYSPESFTCTEMEYAAEVTNAVLDILEPSPENKVIVNLPSTIKYAAFSVITAIPSSPVNPEIYLTFLIFETTIESISSLCNTERILLILNSIPPLSFTYAPASGNIKTFYHHK